MLGKIMQEALWDGIKQGIAMLWTSVLGLVEENIIQIVIFLLIFIPCTSVKKRLTKKKR